MIFYGLNVAAFRIPFPFENQWILDECMRLKNCFLPHNMQTGQDRWETAALKSALGNWRLTDPAFYRHLPEMSSVSGPTMADRAEYMKQWAYTELAAHCPYTTAICQEMEGLGAFMSGARFLKVRQHATVDYHWDNTPHKEFRVTIGLSGMEDEEFVINTGPNKWVRLPMKTGEAWFIDISLGHAVTNKGDNNRYRLGMQFYSPTTDMLLDMFSRCDEKDIVYAEHLQLNSPFQEGPI